jgi:magnesium-transporting ATPase (P-type)
MSRNVAESTSSNVPWCALDNAEVLTRVNSRLQGLTSHQAAIRLGQYGPNRLPSKPPPPLGLIFIHQFLSPLIYILIVAGSRYGAK